MNTFRSPVSHGGQHGAAAVEFALILPFLLLLIFGMVDFARAYNTHISLSGAAREGARVLALGTGDPEQVTKDAAPSLDPAGITVTWNPGDCSGNAGLPAEVNASYEFEYITPISGLMDMVGGSTLTSPITLTGMGVMRCGG